MCVCAFVCACLFFFCVCVCVECSLSLPSGTAIVIPLTIQIIQDIRRLIVPDTCKTMEWDIRTSQRRRGDSHLASRGHRQLWIPFCHPVGPGNEKWQVWTCFQDSGHRHPDARALFQNACIRYAARWAVDRWVCRTYRSDEGCRLSNRCADSHSGDSIASEACQKVCVKVQSSTNSSMRSLMQSVLVSLLFCHVLPPCSESRREVQKLSFGMQQILSNITRFLGSYVGILLQFCCRVCIEWKLLPPLTVRRGGGNKNWGYKLRRARSMTNCEKAGTGWLGCLIKTLFNAIYIMSTSIYLYSR